MIGWIARQIAGAAGPYIVGGVAGVLALAISAAAVQTWRIERLTAAPAKAALKTAETVIARTADADAATQAAGEASERARAEIRYVTRTVVEKVPVYVTAETDRRYPLPWGFVRLHDAAALGLDPAAVPNPAGQPDDAASSVAASVAAAIVAGNYGQCREDQQRLSDLQAWIRTQQALWNDSD